MNMAYRRQYITLLVMLLLPWLSIAVEKDELQVFDVIRMQIAEQIIPVQLANTPEKRAQGLMFQQSAEPGMLLLYSEPQPISLWMANTGIPLDVAFIGADWQVLQITGLKPFDKTPVPSPGAIIAALEMPEGWFARNGIVVGERVYLLTE